MYKWNLPVSILFGVSRRLAPAALPTRGLIFPFLSLPRPLLTPLSPLEAPPDPQTSPAPIEQALYRPDPYTGAFYAICVVD